MTKKEVINSWKENFLPSIKKEEGGMIDKPARRLSFSYYIDGLCKDGEITQKQYDNILYED